MKIDITNPPVGAFNPFWIDYTNQRVGIGTKSPQYQLHIVPASNNVSAEIITNAAETPVVQLKVNSGGDGVVTVFNAAGQPRVNIDAAGVCYMTGSTGLVVGATSINAVALLQLDSTAKGFLPPRMSTAQKNAIGTPPAGLIVYDSTLNKLCVYTTAWETVTST